MKRIFFIFFISNRYREAARKARKKYLDSLSSVVLRWNSIKPINFNTMKHPFFLDPGGLTGEGLMRFKNSSLAYPYTAVWNHKPPAAESVHYTQYLTLSEVEVVYQIDIQFFDIHANTFDVSFENTEYGLLKGTGTWDGASIELALYDEDKVKIFDAVYKQTEPGRYQVQNTVQLANGDILLVDGVLKHLG